MRLNCNTYLDYYLKIKVKKKQQENSIFLLEQLQDIINALKKEIVKAENIISNRIDGVDNNNNQNQKDNKNLMGASSIYPITELEPANISFMIDRCRCPSCRYKGINNLYKMFGLGQQQKMDNYFLTS